MPAIFEYPVCYLTDDIGRRLDPCMANSIQYSVISNQRIHKCKKLYKNEIIYLYHVTVLVKGFITVYINNVQVSSPIPFSETQTLSLYAPCCNHFVFTVKKFSCHASPVFSDGRTTWKLNITIPIDSIARAEGEIEIIVPLIHHLYPAESELPANCSMNKVWLDVCQVYDRTAFTSVISIPYTKTLLRANVYQYNAYSHVSKIYTNADEITEYGNKGILDPNSVSYLNMFINGVMQPQVNYTVTAGMLTLNTSDISINKAPVLIQFITLKDKNGNLLKGEVYQYNTVSNGVKREYTNADELTMYGNKGILNPNDVSFYNAYINGVLQPEINYDLTEGLFVLKTLDVPLTGAPIIVEFVTVKDLGGRPLLSELSQYNTLAANKKIYTNQDELTAYGHDGIPNPELTSYQNLGINGVYQPSVNYTVNTGLLTLNTDDTPMNGAPIYLQSVYLYQQEY